MIKSVGRLLDVNPGFDPDRVLTMQISMVGRAYAKDETGVAKTDDIVARLRALPGVEAVAAAGQIPLGGNGDRWGFHVHGKCGHEGDKTPTTTSATPTPSAATVTDINPIADKLRGKPLGARLERMLPPGMTLNTASAGFKNQGQFIAAMHVSQNLGIPFADLKAAMLGSATQPPLSLGRAIHTLKPFANSTTEASRAQKEAERDLIPTTSSTAAASPLPTTSATPTTTATPTTSNPTSTTAVPRTSSTTAKAKKRGK